MDFSKVKEHHRHYIRGIGMHKRAGKKLWDLYKIKSDYISLLIWVLDLTLTRLKQNGFNQEDIVQGHILYGSYGQELARVYGLVNLGILERLENGNGYTYRITSKGYRALEIYFKELDDLKQFKRLGPHHYNLTDAKTLESYVIQKTHLNAAEKLNKRKDSRPQRQPRGTLKRTLETL